MISTNMNIAKALFVAVGLMASIWLFVAPAQSSAQEFDPLDRICDETTPDAQNSDICGERTDVDPITGEDGVLTVATNIVAVVTGIAAVIIIIISGLRITMSSGSSQSVQKSRDAIIYSAVALVIVLLARTIVLFVVNQLNSE